MHQQYEFSFWEGSPKRFLRTIGDAALRIRRHIPRRLWAFWDSADLPLITKACLNSWPAHFPKHTIVVVTPETIEQYCGAVPDAVRRLSPQKLSDWVRLQVLERYGGIWIDATTLFLGPIDDILAYCEHKRPDLFAFTGGTSDKDFPMFENFFLASPRQGRAIRRINGEYRKVIHQGDANYVKGACRRIGANNAFQKFPNSPYFSQHVAIQMLIRRRPRIKIGYTERKSIPFALQAVYRWDLERLAEVLTNGEEAPKHVRMVKITGKMRKAIEEHLKEHTLHPNSLIGRHLQQREITVTRVAA